LATFWWYDILEYLLILQCSISCVHRRFPLTSRFLSVLLPDASTLSLDAWHVDAAAAQITLRVRATQPRVPCPRCATPARRIHSLYDRTLADRKTHTSDDQNPQRKDRCPLYGYWDCTKIRVNTATASASDVTAWCLGYAGYENTTWGAAG
jgi:hypothetical protein